MTAHLDRFVLECLPPPALQPEFRFDLPELGYPERLNAAVELVDRAVAESAGGRLAIVNDAGRWTYAELAARSDRIARVLVAEGLVPGNRVLLRGPNTATMIAAWLGVLKAGGVAVATMPLLRGGEIATILAKAKVGHAIVDARTLPDFEAGAAEAGTLRSILAYNGDAGGGDLEARTAAVAGGFDSVPTRGDDPALIAFTSGTTGQPKGCVHFHRDVLAPADSFSRHILAPNPDDRFLTSAPLAFTFGLGATLIFPFRARAAAVTVEAPGPGPLLDAVERHGATALFTAPTAYKAMLGQLSGRDIASVRLCVSAGEHLPAATWHAWAEATGLQIVDGIGATEMMHIFIAASGDDIRPGSTGRAVPGYVAAVLDEEGSPLAHGTGRLAIKGPTGCRYLDDVRQSRYVQEGWNVTGDTYRKDEESYFWYLARSDDMIVSSGYNIAAPEVENALYAHTAVEECAVVGVPCEERGERVKAFIVLAPGHRASVELANELQDHVKATIAPYKYPREIAWIDSLPKTATGKLRRHALRPS